MTAFQHAHDARQRVPADTLRDRARAALIEALPPGWEVADVLGTACCLAVAKAAGRPSWKWSYTLCVGRREMYMLAPAHQPRGVQEYLRPLSDELKEGRGWPERFAQAAAAKMARDVLRAPEGLHAAV